jgi:hypothetical protein
MQYLLFVVPKHFVEAHTSGENRMEIKYAANAEGFRTIWTLFQGGNNSGTEIEE